ncbi:purine-cytosine permease family protein [Kineococcus sp. DHX-1]|uniref:purine-cytosine permease family protein n=1 Tax=Kineococcus sp. DHX-1 TaxID=3349638 RepID=UPI0036D2FA05
MSMTTSDSAGPDVEAHHVDPVPETDRRGRARDLFAVWFSANLNVGNCIFGFVIALTCPNIWYAALAVVLGNVLGTVLMALHSVQGARLGIPQLIQSRGQFGYYGALVPVAAAMLMYAGFTVSVTVAGGQSIAAATDGGFGIRPAMLLIAAVSFVIALVGYNAIHHVSKWATVPLTIALLVIGVAAVVHPHTPAPAGPVTLAGFLTATGVATSFALTYAPFVSDYSRYLPSRTSGRAVFGWTAAGVFLSATAVCLLGAFISLKFGAADIFLGARAAMGGGGAAEVVLLVSAVGLVLTNVLNVYGGMLNLITGLSTFVRVSTGFRTRLLTLLPTFVLGTTLAMFASGDFSANLSAFISLLLLLLIPWGAVNLVDFYLVQHGTYDVSAMYARKGPYWENRRTWTVRGVSWKVMASYVIGVAAGFPFAANSWFTGPLAERLGGGDVSWIPGLLVTTAVYVALVSLSRGQAVGGPATHEHTAPREGATP